MPYVATIGFFDGVHRGHQYLIDQVVGEAQARGMQSMVITFAEHPRKVLQPDQTLQLLTTADEKEQLLKQNNVDSIQMLHFTHEMSQMTAREFMQDVLYNIYNVRALVIGYDHRFGHNRNEGFDDYVRYGREIGIDVVLAKEYEESPRNGMQQRFSSTAARNAILTGDMDAAVKILTYHYFIRGTVVHGHHVGTSLGFPTANILVPADKLMPGSGVYAVKVHLKGRAAMDGMLNIGYRPTLANGSDRSVEVNIFDFDEDIYGKEILIEMLHFIRPERKFGSLDELKQQLLNDKETILNKMQE